MKILVVGGGGREHALCWKIAKSPLVSKVYCAPGNAGTALVAENVEIGAEDIAGLTNFAKENKIDLVVVGPEVPLCMGLADALEKVSVRCFGPGKLGAEVEGSKAFARELCRRHRIPSPLFWMFDDPAQAKAFLDLREEGPLVVKASGLAAGKGVTVCKNLAEARVAAAEILERRRFGAAGDQIVFEECLEGNELSVMILTDGRTIVPFDPARDHKPALDGDKGPNTGGMGAFTPVAVPPRTWNQIESQILFPSVHALNRESRPYHGFLYAGLMLTQQGPRVLEYNCRLGDPETQPMMLRLKSDLVPLMLATVDGTLDQQEAPVWDKRSALCVVACSGGYPGDYRKNVPIFGLNKVQTGDDLQVFHAGTKQRGTDTVTSGGRVLAVTALGENNEAARKRAYEALALIEFDGMHFRKDIGAQ